MKMTMRTLMGLVGAIALATWLAVPALRIWGDPGLRSHSHTIGGHDPTTPLTFMFEAPATGKRTRCRVGMLTIDHRATFLDRYRAMLLGAPWPPGEACPGWESIRREYQPEAPGSGRPAHATIEADNVIISL